MIEEKVTAIVRYIMSVGVYNVGIVNNIIVIIAIVTQPLQRGVVIEFAERISVSYSVSVAIISSIFLAGILVLWYRQDMLGFFLGAPLPLLIYFIISIPFAYNEGDISVFVWLFLAASWQIYTFLSTNGYKPKRG